MFKKATAMIVQALAPVIVLVAYTGVSPNSWFILYEPDIPESLKTRTDVNGEHFASGR